MSYFSCAWFFSPRTICLQCHALYWNVLLHCCDVSLRGRSILQFVLLLNFDTHCTQVTNWAQKVKQESCWLSWPSSCCALALLLCSKLAASRRIYCLLQCKNCLKVPYCCLWPKFNNTSGIYIWSCGFMAPVFFLGDIASLLWGSGIIQKARTCMWILISLCLIKKKVFGYLQINQLRGFLKVER